MKLGTGSSAGLDIEVNEMSEIYEDYYKEILDENGRITDIELSYESSCSQDS